MNRIKIISVIAMLILVAQAAEGNAMRAASQENSVQNFSRLDMSFKSQGTLCAAWLYLPKDVRKPPLVIMAHGFGAERSFGLPAFAEHFTRQGLACLVFDYRTFGDSKGEPRNYVNPNRHLEDWQAAIAFARSLDSVDNKRMALWGTSFSGGHVIVTAARTPGISAVVAQVPFVDGLSTGQGKSVTFTLQAVYHGLRDIVESALFNRRHYVLMAADPGTFAVMNTPDALEGCKKIIPADVPLDRKCPADILLKTLSYRPVKSAPDVTCPALIIYAESDSLISPRDVKKMGAGMKKATVIGLPIGHFEIYAGEPFEKAVRLEAEFLIQQLVTGSRGTDKNIIAR